MRLLTHNLLQCNVRNCATSPLTVKHTQTEIIESEFDPKFIVSMLPKLDYQMLFSTSEALGLYLIPSSYTPADLEDQNFLKAVHDLICDFHIIEGSLECPKCQRVFPIHKGIPNMLLQKHEVL
jgi:multifunctional methyltransferase subunit TRM112